MFTLASTTRAYQLKYLLLLKEWNALVKRVNERGGESFLNGPPATAPGPGLSDEDIRRLVHLCHPDKHGGKQIAVEMTQKLLSLRGHA